MIKDSDILTVKNISSLSNSTFLMYGTATIRINGFISVPSKLMFFCRYDRIRSLMT